MTRGLGKGSWAASSCRRAGSSFRSCGRAGWIRFRREVGEAISRYRGFGLGRIGESAGSTRRKYPASNIYMAAESGGSPPVSSFPQVDWNISYLFSIDRRNPSRRLAFGIAVALRNAGRRSGSTSGLRASPAGQATKANIEGKIRGQFLHENQKSLHKIDPLPGSHPGFGLGHRNPRLGAAVATASVIHDDACHDAID